MCGHGISLAEQDRISAIKNKHPKQRFYHIDCWNKEGRVREHRSDIKKNTRILKFLHKKVNVHIKLVTRFRRAFDNAKLSLEKIDNLIGGSELLEGESNQEGIFRLASIPKGLYLFKITRGNIHLEYILEIINDISAVFILPVWFRFIPMSRIIKHSNISIETRKFKDTYMPKDACFKCADKLRGLDSYTCHYCHRNYCPIHRLPEDHDCLGNVVAPPFSYRVIFSSGRDTIIAK